MFTALLLLVENVISQAFSWAESIWSSFGLSLVTITVVLFVSMFVVRNYIKVFLR